MNNKQQPNHPLIPKIVFLIIDFKKASIMKTRFSPNRAKTSKAGVHQQTTSSASTWPKS